MLLLAGQEKCWMSMSHKVDLGQIPLAQLMITSKYQYSVLLNSSISWPAVNCLSFAKLYSGPYKIAELFYESSPLWGNSFSHEMKMKAEVWLHSSMNWAVLCLHFFLHLHIIGVVWRTEAMVPVTCIDRSRQSVPGCVATWEILLRSVTLSPPIAIWSHPRISAMWHRSVSQA